MLFSAEAYLPPSRAEEEWRHRAGPKMSAMDVEDFIGQNRELSDLVDTFRSISESEKHWTSRREFIFRNINDYEDPHLDQLLALSMVWANHVFLGCRSE